MYIIKCQNKEQYQNVPKVKLNHSLHYFFIIAELSQAPYTQRKRILYPAHFMTLKYA